MIRPGRLLVAALPLVTALLTASCGSGGQTADTDSCPFDNKSAGPYSPNPPATNGKTDKAQVMPEMPHDHVAPPARIQYVNNPPTSGCHYSLSGQAPMAPGAYTNAVEPEFWVHNLEHGYIVVLYNCPTGCADDFQKLRAWAAKLPPDPGLKAVADQNPSSGFTPYTKILILPYTNMQPKFAAISWDYYDPMSSLDLTEIQAFYDNHVGHSPEGPSTS